MARKFLYVIAGIVVLVMLALLALRIWSEELTEIAMVPKAKFRPQAALAPNIYDDPAMWVARPGLGASDPAMWVPKGLEEDADALAVPVFFIHPTSYLDRAKWNASVDEPEARKRAALFVQGMASPFNKSVDVWAPRYRQAAFGAFLTDKPEGKQAIDLAYQDVAQAFDFFLKTVARDKPIVLAGHSQGAFHLRRLLKEKVAGKPVAGRIAAAYVIGWPVSLEHDLPQTGLVACTRPDQAGCVVSWLSVAEPADTGILLRGYARQRGLDGKDLAGSPFLCSNPLTGTANAAAPASANGGTLVFDLERRSGALVPGKVAAACRKDGFLSIGAPPELGIGPYVLPGNNYHLFDVTLFWRNLREDFQRRVQAWKPGV